MQGTPNHKPGLTPHTNHCWDNFPLQAWPGGTIEQFKILIKNHHELLRNPTYIYHETQFTQLFASTYRLRCPKHNPLSAAHHWHPWGHPICSWAVRAQLVVPRVPRVLMVQGSLGRDTLGLLRCATARDGKNIGMDDGASRAQTLGRRLKSIKYPRLLSKIKNYYDKRFRYHCARLQDYLQ